MIKTKAVLMIDYISKIPPKTMIELERIRDEQNLISFVDVLEYLVRYYD
jgi:hypothetical protein